ncbi:hypothetical protein ZHAS_00015966 [Anopheles sinensis]|uniref:Uncharacterized protein n=1 Tax=Anopheles sinensis TaxID=74873 RepID=A0A084WCG4_ANOSI|nr:hypothetical protein ZHAS_00015966 [Anopheles sinensis]
MQLRQIWLTVPPTPRTSWLQMGFNASLDRRTSITTTFFTLPTVGNRGSSSSRWTVLVPSRTESHAVDERPIRDHRSSHTDPHILSIKQIHVRIPKSVKRANVMNGGNNAMPRIGRDSEVRKENKEHRSRQACDYRRNRADREFC